MSKQPLAAFYIEVKNGEAVGLPTDAQSCHWIGERDGLAMDEDGTPTVYEPYHATEQPTDPTNWKRKNVQDDFYSKDDMGFWTKKWQIKDKTKAELKKEKAEATSAVIDGLGYKSWTWNDTTGIYEPPIQPEKDGPRWWDEEKQEWYRFEIDENGERVRID